jgi:ParB family chromosome partitioning protein
MTKQRLGTNLNALLNYTKLTKTNSSALNAHKESPVNINKEYQKLPIETVVRGSSQPRNEITAESLEELTLSIKQQGILQPIVVRPTKNKNYEIIAGERRWRAAQLAGLDDIPAIIKKVSDETAVALALIENIQRENLNPIEEAVSLLRLQKEFKLTQKEVAETVGKSRVAITNTLRLLSLHDEVKKMLECGEINTGHARALIPLSVDEQLYIAEMIITKGLSVRQTEILATQLKEKQQIPNKKVRAKNNPDIIRLENELSEKVGAHVQLKTSSKSKGKLIISYNSLDELDGILAHIK